MTDRPLYLDTNATTPIDHRVADAMLPYLREHFGNPGSGHVYGQAARTAVDKARKQVADLLGCAADEVTFTSGGSESNNWAIKGAAWAREARGRHLGISAAGHTGPFAGCPVRGGARRG
ncbi:aminotransferase class V-fold PLP-dependent enzyme, partial [bacterium]|nr:aminotransferase class V-fold PLP-dependent enzyme [bacterium]